jgi:hypothetical protein
MEDVRLTGKMTDVAVVGVKVHRGEPAKDAVDIHRVAKNNFVIFIRGMPAVTCEYHGSILVGFKG